MAIPTDELLQEDFSFPVQGYDIEQIRQSIANRIPLLGSQRGVYGGGPMGGGFNLTGYTPQYSSMVGPIATGQAYAQQIAGGMPFSQVVAPGMSFSPERPQGYTQAELFLQDGAPIMPPPPGQTFVPFQGDMMPGETVEPLTPPPSAQIGVPPPMPTIFGFPAPQLPPIDLSQLPEIDLSQITIPESVKSSLGELLGIPKIDVSQFVTKEEIPSFIPPVQMPQIPQIDTSQFIGREELPALLKDIPINIPQVDTSQFIGRQELPNILAGLPQAPQVDVSRFIGREELPSLLKDIPLNIPKIDTSQFVSREDISGLRSDILGSLPQVQLPDVSKFVTQADINKALATIPPAEQLDRQALIRDIESQLKIPERFDPTALQQQIGGLQQQIAGLPQPQQIDVGALRSDILSQVPRFDPTELQSQIAANKALLESLPQPEQLDRQALIRDIQSQIKVPERFDPTGLESQISGLQSQIQGIPQFDPTSLQARLGGLEQQLANIPQPQQIDIGALRQDILSSVPQTNLAGYITESQLQQALQGIPQPTMPDVSQFVTQADINRAIAGIPQVSLSDIEARLAALESTPSIGVPKLPRPTGLFA